MELSDAQASKEGYVLPPMTIQRPSPLMKVLILLFIVMLPCVTLQSQISFLDTFPGNLPGAHWLGDTLLFTIDTAGRLQLRDTAGGEAWLSTWAPANDSAIWEGFVKLDFPPSPSNRLRIYLGASHPDIHTTAFHGYFLQVGASGQEDCLELWRQDVGGNQTLLITGTAGSAAQNPMLRYRVTRTQSGTWVLMADHSGGINYQVEGSAVDSTYTMLEYFSIHCQYTSTRKSHFYFDDFLVTPLFVDTIPPTLIGLWPNGENRIKLRFSEPIDPHSGASPDAYQLDCAQVLAASAISSEEVELYCTGLNKGAACELLVSGLTDRSGNPMVPQHWMFEYFLLRGPEPYDILIHEIFADPDTTLIANGLPDAEWVELLNRSDDAIQLRGMQLADPGSSAIFPEFVLMPDSMLVVCSAEDAHQLGAVSPVAGLDKFPNLNNDSDRLSLLDSNGRVLHSVAYDRSWYGSTQKDDGGYSLELIAPQEPCRGRDNWRASEALLGATPGRPNSVYSPVIDDSGPFLLRATPATEQNLTLVFSEALDLETMQQPDRYLVDGHEVWAASISALNPESVFLTLDLPMEPSVICTLRILEAEDCLGHARSDNAAVVALPEPPEPGDIVLNEILFDPKVGGKDFVEFLNRSDKVVQMADLTLSNGHQHTALATPFLLFPGQLIAYSEDPADIRTRYHCAAPERLFANALPTFPPDTGSVLLLLARFPDTVITSIDSIRYNKDYHHPLLSTSKGVSLERLGDHLPGTSPFSWHSAAELSGFATPTGRNSQAINSLNSDTSAFFSLDYKTFSPNGDGFRDQLRISYKCDRPGYLLRAMAFDANGRAVAMIANNQSLGQSGILVWDGVMAGRHGVQSGIYIIFLEAHHPDGYVHRQRLTTVVAMPWR